MYPDNSIGAEYRSDEPVIVQLDLPHSFNCDWKGCHDQNRVGIAEMIDDDYCRSLLWEIFQSADCGSHRKKREQFCKSPGKGPKSPPRKRQTR